MFCDTNLLEGIRFARPHLPWTTIPRRRPMSTTKPGGPEATSAYGHPLRFG
jgi:hypothetical protein